MNVEMSTFELVKEIFNGNNRGELQDLNSMVTKRLKKLKGYGLIRNENEKGKTVYSINMDALVCASGTLEVEPKKEELPSKNFNINDILMVVQDSGLMVFAFIPTGDGGG